MISHTAVAQPTPSTYSRPYSEAWSLRQMQNSSKISSTDIAAKVAARSSGSLPSYTRKPFRVTFCARQTRIAFWRFFFVVNQPQRARPRDQVFAQQGVNAGVIISDSAGRAWRNGIAGFAIGSAGVPALRSAIGAKDLFGRELEVTEMADADELASAASLLMGQGSESVPAVLIRGWQWAATEQTAAALIRDRDADLFR